MELLVQLFHCKVGAKVGQSGLQAECLAQQCGQEENEKKKAKEELNRMK